ncbi:MAG: ABC transporter ATP-binding protein, partial [Candidatus Neomarinimicrobiota bacterium]
SGDRRVGPDVRLGYYAQHHEENLDPDQTVLESLASVAPEWGETALRSHLGAFRFTGDNVHKRVGILSGGEQARLVLARLLAQPAHALLLDEPTNHLDLMTREALQTALADYPGALVLISHDRTLLDTVTSTTVAVRNGALRIYQGTISDYLRNQEQNREPPGPVLPGPTSSTRAREFRERRRRNNRLKTLDRLLREKERELREVVTQLEDPVRSSDYEALISLQTTKESLEETILELLLEQETLRQDNR